MHNDPCKNVVKNSVIYCLSVEGCTLCEVLGMKLGKKFLAVNWKVIDGAAKQERMLRLRPDEDGIFMCPLESCMHTGFKSSRGLGKHIDTRHNWYYHFDNKPTVK